jgi:hypothetical protein
MTPGRGIKSRTPSDPRGKAAGRGRDPEELEWDPLEDSNAFDRPTLIPTTAPESLGTEADQAESAILRRGSAISESRVPVFDRNPEFDPFGPPDDFDALVPEPGTTSPPPRSQMPTLVEDDAMALDLRAQTATSAPDDLSLDLDEPPVRAAAPIKFRQNARTAQDPLGEDRAAAMGSPRSEIPAVRRFQNERPTVPPDEQDEGGALNLVSRGPSSGGRTGSRPSYPPPPDTQTEMRDKFALGDFSGALTLAESLLATDPSHSEAARYAETCRDRLRQMYASRLGSLTKVPRVIVPPDQVRWLSLDHRAGFILSCVDGYSTIEEILDVSGMPTLDALRVLFDLLQQRIIAVS